MRLRIRHPDGQVPVSLPSEATVSDLLRVIGETVGFKNFALKAGYPPQTLDLSRFPENLKLTETKLELDGQQLIVSPNDSLTDTARQTASDLEQKTPKKFKSTKSSERDAPEIRIPSHDATLVLRVMPDDNSCLFRAFNSAFFGPMDNVHELRSVIAQSIQAQPDTYTAVVLEQTPDDYCRWITTEDAWGGAIELEILSRFFDLEIASIDVQTLRVDRYNEGKRRCMLVYSGIHYDVIAMSPRINAPPDQDIKIFDTQDDAVLQGAMELCRALRQQHYFTDTSSFKLECRQCGEALQGEKDALQHAQRTGHSDFGETSSR